MPTAHWLAICLVTASLGACVLPAPDDFAVEEGVANLTLSWSAVEDAESYNLYWRDDGEDPAPGEGEEFADVESPFLHEGLSIGAEYRYLVVAEDEGGEGEPSEVVTGVPQPPSRIGTMSIDFTFCCAPEAIGYALWIGDAEGNYVDTIVHYIYYQLYMDSRMPVWEARRISDLDGITEASSWTGTPRHLEWDGLDRDGNELPLGTYQIWLEVNDRIFPNCISITTMELGYEPLVVEEVNCNVNGWIRYKYEPWL